MSNRSMLPNRFFTKKYADNSQKTGGKVWKAVRGIIAYSGYGVPKAVPQHHAVPQPSEHARMRKEGRKGPAEKTKARKDWVIRTVKSQLRKRKP